MEITVVTPFHNVEMNIFENCYQSILSQTIGLENVEWIIVLHNCEKKFVEAVKEKVKGRPNILTPELYNDARTPSSPRNYGLSMATGDYIGFLDGDDSYISTCLETALQNIRETHADILCFKRESEMENTDALPIAEGFLLDQTKERFIVNRDTWDAEKTFVSIWGMVTSKIYSRRFLEKNQLRFDESILFAEDEAFNLQAYILAERICYLPQYVGYHYYINSASLVQTPVKNAAQLLAYVRGFEKIFRIGMKNGIFMNNAIGGLLYHTARFLEISGLDTAVRREIRDILSPYLRIVKPFDVCAIYTEEDVRLRYDYPKRVIPDVGAADVWSDPGKKEYPLTQAQKYQKAVMEAGHSSIEAIEMDRYYELEGYVDEERLAAAVRDALRAHEVYRVRINGSAMRISDDQPVVALYYFTEELFREYRAASYSRKLDCEKEPPIQVDVICCVKDYIHHAPDVSGIVGKKYLHIKASHYIHDQVSLCNLFDEISHRYSGDAAAVPEETLTIFDISEAEQKERESEQYASAKQFFAKQYAEISDGRITGREGENTLLLRTILSSMGADELDRRVREKNLTTGIFIIGMFEKTIAEYFGKKEFSYMLLSDGRNGEEMKKTHGVLAKGVYVTSSTGRTAGNAEFFGLVSQKVRESIANNTVDFSELIQEYGYINSLVTINYVGNNRYKHRILGREPEHRFSSEHAAALKAFCVLNLHIEKIGQAFHLTAMSYSLDRDEMNRLVELFEKNILEALCGPEGGQA